MEKSTYIFKGLGYSYILTLVVILIYNAILTFTGLAGSTITMAVSFITIFSSAFGGFYACKHIKEKGLMYGLLVGLLYIILLFTLVYLAREKFVFEINTLYSMCLTTIAGGIGGVLGVNFK